MSEIDWLDDEEERGLEGKTIEERINMLYKYSAVLDINPIVDIQDDTKSLLDTAISEYNIKYSSLDELSIKEQLKFYIDKHLPYHTDRIRMIELIDKL